MVISALGFQGLVSCDIITVVVNLAVEILVSTSDEI